MMDEDYVAVHASRKLLMMLIYTIATNKSSTI